MAREDLLGTLHKQVTDSVEAGARLLRGGQRLESAGAYYAPTLLSGVEPGMPVADEEAFGPAASLFQVADVEEAVHVANQTRYGLGSSIWTTNISLAKELAPRIEAGSVFINGMVSSDPRVPFGGVKQSGYGRELSEFGIHEFVNIQTVSVGPRSS